MPPLFPIHFPFGLKPEMGNFAKRSCCTKQCFRQMGPVVLCKVAHLVKKQLCRKAKKAQKLVLSRYYICVHCPHHCLSSFFFLFLFITLSLPSTLTPLPSFYLSFSNPSLLSMKHVFPADTTTVATFSDMKRWACRARCRCE